MCITYWGRFGYCAPVTSAANLLSMLLYPSSTKLNKHYSIIGKLNVFHCPSISVVSVVNLFSINSNLHKCLYTNPHASIDFHQILHTHVPSILGQVVEVVKVAYYVPAVSVANLSQNSIFQMPHPVRCR